MKTIKFNKDNNFPGSIKTKIGVDSFNCTTLRVDKVADGRYAVVEFIKDWELDSARRDFTVNSMYLSLDGTLFDYHGGYHHARETVINFVGEPDDRIKEDYLRILRYFRFYGRIANDPDNHDEKITVSIKQNADGLSKLTGARIWMELKQIVVGNYAPEILSKMLQCGLAPYLNLPSTFDINSCFSLLNRCRNVEICPKKLNPVTIIAAGLSNVDDAYTFLARSKSTKLERQILIFIIENRNLFMDTNTHSLLKKPDDEFLRLSKHFLYEGKLEETTIMKIVELLKYCGLQSTIKELYEWQIPEFPVEMSDLAFIRDFKTRRKVRDILIYIWGESDHKLTHKDLIDKVDNVLIDLERRNL